MIRDALRNSSPLTARKVAILIARRVHQMPYKEIGIELGRTDQACRLMCLNQRKKDPSLAFLVDGRKSSISPVSPGTSSSPPAKAMTAANRELPALLPQARPMTFLMAPAPQLTMQEQHPPLQARVDSISYRVDRMSIYSLCNKQ